MESPFACDMNALNEGQRRRYSQLVGKLSAAQQEVRELPDGYAFRFAAESQLMQELVEFTSYERLCCPFFDLELLLEREGGPTWLRLRGRMGVKEFIRSEFNLAPTVSPYPPVANPGSSRFP